MASNNSSRIRNSFRVPKLSIKGAFLGKHVRKL